MFYCDGCGEPFCEEEVKYRIENDTFTAPFGDTFVNGGGKSKVETCPICGEDLEEVVE